MSNAFIIAKNTLKIVFKKKINIFIYILLPVVIVVALVNLLSFGDSKINVGIYNQGKSGTLSDDFVRSIKNQSRYRVKYVNKADIKKVLVNQKVDCIVMIPRAFDEKVYAGRINKIDIKSIKGQDATAWIKKYIDFYISNLMKISRASNGNREVFDNIYKDSDQLKVKEIKLKGQYRNNTLSEMSIGFVTMFMLLGSSTVSGFILKEKRKRTYFRIFSTPTSERTYLIGNFLAGMFVLLTQAALISFFITGILGMDVKMNSVELFFMLAVFSLVSSALGSTIVAFAQNTSQAGYISTFIVTPSSMLSGCFWPVDVMPDFMQKLSYFFPQRWLIEGVRRVQQSGNYAKAFPCMMIILGFAVALFLLSMFKIKTSKSIKNFV
ncbi:ABC transporter permease [Clostridium oryzae]|uniref:Inner membrane transport permease YbhS n=1 Tax=Clostridium oryzae TaxID=1450648 RepID=A0A1V4IQD4_9CLOT|nr:ABC transporter permease [Clostridium oryzae]OPJ62241.1 inner membrane transport permease YbhS [Clostridium oryzae]